MDKIDKRMLIVAIISSFITSFMGSALNLAIPNIENYFNVGTALVGWIINSYMLTCAVLAVPFGIIGDIYGKRKILIIGLVVFVVSSVMAIFSVNIIMLIVIRAVQGIGTAMIYSTNIAILAENTEQSLRGRNLGIATAANYFGLSAGPVLGGFVNYYFGWKGIFMISAVFSLLALIFSFSGIPDSRKKRNKIDFKGIIKNKRYLTSNLATFINFGAMFSINYMVSIYLQETKGFNSKTAGFILVCAPIIQTIISPIIGKLSDKYSPHKISAIGMGICSVVIISFSFVTRDTSILFIIVLLCLSGLGSGVFSTPNTNAVMASLDKNLYGIASSVLSTMRSLGHASATTVIMALGDMKISFIVIGITCIGGIFMALYHKS